MYVYMYVCTCGLCVYVCMYVCMHICNECIYVYMYICTRMYVCVCMYVFMYVCMYVCMCAGSLSTCARKCTVPLQEQAAEESGSSYCSATVRQYTNLRSRMCSWHASRVHVMNGFCSREYKYGCTCRVQGMSEVMKGFQFIIYRLSQHYAT
jgi:hypothetical protein